MIKKLIKKFLINYQDNKKRMIGLSHIINTRNKYSKITNLNDLDYKIFSQNGEDGIIDYILECLKIKKPNFIEIGIGDYSESNTRFIFETRSLRGLVIDCLSDLKKKINQNIKSWKGELNIEEIFISTENILEILDKNNFYSTDLLSIDIDGIDYWILNKLKKNYSKIIVLEYNSVFGNNIEVTVPNINSFNRSNYHFSNLCYGMSLKAAIKLMDKKNYYFLGTNYLKNNAFFISKDFPKSQFFPNLEIEQISEATNSYLTESRNTKGKLNFLKGADKLKEIMKCKIIDLSNDKQELKKLDEIINN